MPLLVQQCRVFEMLHRVLLLLAGVSVAVSPRIGATRSGEDIVEGMFPAVNNCRLTGMPLLMYNEPIPPGRGYQAIRRFEFASSQTRTANPAQNHRGPCA